MKRTILPKKNIIAQSNTQHPFGHATVKAQVATTAGHAKALVLGKAKPKMATASRTVKGLPVVKQFKTSTLGN